ncbi:PKD domain-containing protein [Natrinema ejinorense]|uniref:Succinylglutamate desuccinylase n=1 Tax=Natrinema ejinorense TaxID=373386 RepID=A0A2A5QS19_9EURY|nr:PKD domain-containing protein [Natrinema ejinorense]PCR89641.1 succinylglutamate desuccinylase [Natrinema ejinorense]
MRRDTLSRRSLLAATAGCTLISTSVASVVGNTAQNDGEGVNRDSILVREGTDEETTVSVTTGGADGPTAVVVGGMHGNEVAGYAAAGRIADLTIDAGTLVTVPEANAVAIERGTRNDDEGTNLNRQFPEGETPDTRLARELWDVVSESDPDILIDLHESTGIYAGDPADGVGQAIFHSSGDEAADAATDAADFVTRNHVDDPALAFQTGPFSKPDTDPAGLLAHKAARDLDADGFLAETLSTGVELETRVQWHTAIVERLLEDELLLDADDGSPSEEPVDEEPADPEPEPEEPVDDGADGDESPEAESPIARIGTRPASATETVLEPGQTVTLDASKSRDPDGELVAYEWCVGADGSFEAAGETIEVTIGANGDHPVALRVVDDDGSTDIDRITLSANC